MLIIPFMLFVEFIPYSCITFVLLVYVTTSFRHTKPVQDRPHMHFIITCTKQVPVCKLNAKFRHYDSVFVYCRPNYTLKVINFMQ